MKLMLIGVLAASAASAAFADNGNNPVPANPSISRSFDCAAMIGAQVAAKALTAHYLVPNGQGDYNYWYRTYEVARDSANAIATSIRQDLMPALTSCLP